MKVSYRFLIPIFLVLFFCSCGSGSRTTTHTSITDGVDISDLDGTTDVPVDSTFTYTFTTTVYGPSVDHTTFFIVPAPSADSSVSAKASAVDSDICDPSNGLSATDECSGTRCSLDPAEDLSENTRYAICLTDEILLYNGNYFGGLMATFTTEGEDAAECDNPTDPGCSSAEECACKYNGDCNNHLGGEEGNQPVSGGTYSYDFAIESWTTGPPSVTEAEASEIFQCIANAYATSDDLELGCLTAEHVFTDSNRNEMEAEGGCMNKDEDVTNGLSISALWGHNSATYPGTTFSELVEVYGDDNWVYSLDGFNDVSYCDDDFLKIEVQEYTSYECGDTECVCMHSAATMIGPCDYATTPSDITTGGADGTTGYVYITLEQIYDGLQALGFGDTCDEGADCHAYIYYVPEEGGLDSVELRFTWDDIDMCE
jgi:hypothetical protein